ncbi:molybdopterin dinucleotide binding domain-containing protein, partial [Nostoc sp. NIES-2111]
MNAGRGWGSAPQDGRGLRLLTGRITSPTRLRLIERLLSAVPGSAWHAYEPTDGPSGEGARLAFGREIEVVPHLDRADVVLCLDADPLGPGPDQIRLSRGWSARRREAAALPRVFVLESAPPPTGAKADERMSAHPAVLQHAVLAVARALGADVPEAVLPPDVSRFVAAAVAALQGAQGRAIVLAGRTLPAEGVALVHWINESLGAPVDLVEQGDRTEAAQPRDVAALRDDLEAGRVGALVVIGANPAYNCPSLDLARHLPGLALSLHHGLHVDETAELCGWHLPSHHPLEAWSDLRSLDGTAAVAQPLIRPLYETLSADVLLARLAGLDATSDLDLVRQTWLPRWTSDAEGAWRTALKQGVVEGTTFAPIQGLRAALPATAPAGPPSQEMALVLQPHHATFDGSRGNNAWLQECPAPFGKQVWGNALRLAPADAARAGVADGDVVSLTAGKVTVNAPVQVTPGQAAGTVALAVGQGRRKAGAIGTGVGVDAWPLQPAPGTWVVHGVRLEKTGRRQEILSTQQDVRLEAAREDLYPILSPGQAVRNPGVDAARPDFY